MARRDAARVVVEYGVLAPTGPTVLLVTDDYAEAEHALDLIGEGRLVRRVVTYGQWTDVAVSKNYG